MIKNDHFFKDSAIRGRLLIIKYAIIHKTDKILLFSKSTLFENRER